MKTRVKCSAVWFGLTLFVAIGHVSAAEYKNYPALTKFLANLQLEVITCHLEEELRSGENRAERCASDAKEKARSLYPDAAKEVKAKPSAEAKLKAVLASWLAIMNAIPRPGLSRAALKLEQRRDDRMFGEKLAEFEAEFSF